MSLRSDERELHAMISENGHNPDCNAMIRLNGNKTIEIFWVLIIKIDHTVPLEIRTQPVYLGVHGGRSASVAFIGERNYIPYF